MKSRWAVWGLGLFLASGGVLGTSRSPAPFNVPESRAAAVTPADSCLSDAVGDQAVTYPGTSRQDYTSLPLELLAERCPEPFVPSEPKREQVQRYVARWGDSLWSIARKFNVDMETLVAANGLAEDRYLRTGQSLVIPPGKGLYYRVKPGESLEEICERYQVSLQEVRGKNRIGRSSSLVAGQRLFLPGASAEEPTLDLIWPVRGRLTSGFGMRQHPMGGGWKRHEGIDIAAPVGRLVRAAQEGEVVFVGYRGTIGRTVVLEHANQYQTVYGHNSEILVKVGQRVQRGQAIARVGNTGLSTGPHLHFEVRKAGCATDPLPYLP